ncbi:MAG: aldehyde dehydrogenase family protein, partial [Planctomycetota bacterium]
DLAHAAETCVTARLLNSGQTCIAAKRFVVVEAVREEFTARVVEALDRKRYGDPIAEPEVDLGPLAREDLRATLHKQVERSVAAGARLLLGGRIPDRPGWFYPPTLLTDVPPKCPAAEEELFGPVAKRAVGQRIDVREKAALDHLAGVLRRLSLQGLVAAHGTGAGGGPGLVHELHDSIALTFDVDTFAAIRESGRQLLFEAARGAHHDRRGGRRGGGRRDVRIGEGLSRGVPRQR